MNYKEERLKVIQKRKSELNLELENLSDQRNTLLATVQQLWDTMKQKEGAYLELEREEKELGQGRNQNDDLSSTKEKQNAKE